MLKSFFVISALVAVAVGQEASVPTPIVFPPARLCSKNEYYLPQGIAPNCDTRCTRIGRPCNVIYKVAPSGCYCLPDHARDANNVCVPIAECRIWCLRIRREPIDIIWDPISPTNDPIDTITTA